MLVTLVCINQMLINVVQNRFRNSASLIEIESLPSGTDPLRMWLGNIFSCCFAEIVKQHHGFENFGMYHTVQ